MKASFLLVLLLTASYTMLAQDGILDDTFGDDGRVVWNYGSGFENAADIIIQDDGKLIVIGSATETNTKVMAARFNADGSVDDTFGYNNGMALIEVVQGVNYGIKGAFQSDGRIIIGARTGDGVYNDFTCIRLNSDGLLDNTFATNGIFNISLGTSTEELNDIKVLPDNKILLAGSAGDTDVNENFALVKLNADGTLDNSFGDNGIVVHDVTGKFDRIKAIAVMSSGDILGAGAVWEETRVLTSSLVRFNSDGSIDESFGTNGVISITPGPAASFFNDVEILPDGSILAAGVLDYNSQYDFMAARFNSDGTLDSQFGEEGVFATLDADISRYLSSMQAQSDGKLVLIGHEGTWPESDFSLLRLTPNGTPDNSFGSNGYVVTDFFNGYDYTTGSVLQPDGKLVACGSADNNGDYNLAMARYISGTGVGIEEQKEILVSLEVYPNPASSDITINFELEENAIVTVGLYDVSGRVVKVLCPAKLYQAGQNTVAAKIMDIKQGVYFLQITSDKKAQALMISKL